MPSLRMPRLYRRGGVYQFRMAVPRDLMARFGVREIRGTLKTNDPIVARIRCRNLSNAFDTLVAKVKTMPGLSTEKINDLIRSYFADRLATASELALMSAHDEHFDDTAELEEIGAQRAGLHRKLAKRSYDDHTRSVALKLLSDAGLKAPPQASEEFDTLCHGILRAELERHRMPYSKQELQKLLSSAQYTGHKSETSRHRSGKLIIKDGKYWIPLVALFTGMRLGEIVQLLVTDMKSRGVVR